MNKRLFVLCFQSDVYNYDELRQMSQQELYDLAAVDGLAGDDHASTLTPGEFQELFNTGCIDAIWTNIFFVNV